MIRKMRSEDLEEVAEIEKMCFSPGWSFSILESGLFSDYDEYYVFEQNNTLLGYCNIRFLAGEGEIERICVRPDCRRLGIGKMLMNEMLNSALWYGANGVTLEVRAGNEPARKLYENFGFTVEGLRKNYYTDPAEDALIMWKRGI